MLPKTYLAFQKVLSRTLYTKSTLSCKWMEGKDLECEVSCLKFKRKQLSEIQKPGNTSTH